MTAVCCENSSWFPFLGEIAEDQNQNELVLQFNTHIYDSIIILYWRKDEYLF